MITYILYEEDVCVEKNKKLLTIIAGFLTLMVATGMFYQIYSKNTQTPQKNGQEETDALDFNVQNDDGTNTYLSDFYDGKPIIINFFASTCRPCQLEMPDFMELYEQYQNDVHFVMIDSIGALGETKEKARAFLTENNYTFPVYYDVNRNAVSTYGVHSFPTTYILNGEQQIVAGGTGMIEKETVQRILEDLLQKE